MRRNLFWLSEEQWKRIEPHLPRDVRGVERVDDHRVISGIVHVLKSGYRWCDCPPEYGPPQRSITALCAGRGVWENLLRELAGNGRSTDTQMIDSNAPESAPLGSGWKRGEQKQGVGRSRGGRNTKIRAVADVKGRLIAILLTTGEAHDCPVAERLVRRVSEADAPGGCVRRFLGNHRPQLA